MKIKPSPNGDTAGVIIACSSKLQAVKPCDTMFYVGKEKGKGIAFEFNPEQLEVAEAGKTVSILGRKVDA